MKSRARQRQKEEKRENQRKEKIRRKKMQMCKNYRKITNYFIFLIIYASGSSKSRLAKVAGAEPAGQIRDEKLLTNQNLRNSLFPDHF